MMNRDYDKKIILEDGGEFYGYGFGADCEMTAEELLYMSRTQIAAQTDHLSTGLLLAMSAGFMDAYSYLCRGKVFANAQTGNILLLGVNLANGNFTAAVQYLVPVTAFALGIALACVIRHFSQGWHRTMWKHTVLLVVTIGLFLTAFIPKRWDWAANCMISLVCALQLESFPEICGCPVATTMCIGNLRSAVHAFMEFCYGRKQEELRKMGIYLAVILAFAVGAVLGDFLIARLDEKAIWGSCVILIICTLNLSKGRNSK